MRKPWGVVASLQWCCWWWLHPICPMLCDSDQSSGTHHHRWGQPYLSITFLRAKAWSAEVTSSRKSHIRRAPNCKDFQKKTTLNGKLTQQCIVLTNKVANETVNLSRFKCIPQSPKTGRYARLFVVSQYLKSSIHFASLKKMRLPFQDTKIFLFLSFLYMCVCFLIVTYSFWNQLNAKFKSGINSTLVNKLS